MLDFCGYVVTMVAGFPWLLLPWFLDFYGYSVTMVDGFPLLLCYSGCWFSMITLLPWLLVFHFYSATVVAGFPWLLFCRGCWFSIFILLPWLLVFHDYSFVVVAGFPFFSATMVAGFPWFFSYHGYDIIDCWVASNRGYHVHDRADFRGFHGFRVYQGLIKFLRVEQLTGTPTTNEFNPENTRVTSVRFGVNKLNRVKRLIPCWQRFTVDQY